jgi:hypothetical protein
MRFAAGNKQKQASMFNAFDLLSTTAAEKKTAEVYQQIFSAESFSSSAVHTCVFCRKPTNMHSYDPKILATEQIKLSETIQIIGCRDVNCNILVISLLKEPKYWGISI